MDVVVDVTGVVVDTIVDEVVVDDRVIIVVLV